jgi:hypothetical protein
VYLATGEYEDGTLGEIFIDANKTGSMVRALLGAVAIAVSRALQYGVPLEEFIASFKEFHFHPAGAVEGDPRITEAYSILDCIFTELEETYIKSNLPAREERVVHVEHVVEHRKPVPPKPVLDPKIDKIAGWYTTDTTGV